MSRLIRALFIASPVRGDAVLAAGPARNWDVEIAKKTREAVPRLKWQGDCSAP